jgi:hypothetical protein
MSVLLSPLFGTYERISWTPLAKHQTKFGKRALDSFVQHRSESVQIAVSKTSAGVSVFDE